MTNAFSSSGSLNFLTNFLLSNCEIYMRFGNVGLELLRRHVCSITNFLSQLNY